ncbi:hypothetical protein PF005_g21680 [Phytophthora fragariae]|uniref:Uncharacterized protein n=2 Tax=Phytophthora TaxID=4783 RepID=A0A6A3EU15_9STRA|nr:hypothetical protein PF003_g11563 [Phytophthora fragariae]KAE8983224.1 hypothetical protein PR002_g23315 [Phytophthora rubi]KAE8936974.1 hypothetical protein PF009_g13116 [Phytophthora fragariae]KAE8978181.1 hypothetical protein PF011_g23349 [Phytophthora fragariae]KAE9083837.1 hypothetical protein PF007_g21747 [Phytophthora fragariae]
MFDDGQAACYSLALIHSKPNRSEVPRRIARGATEPFDES